MSVVSTVYALGSVAWIAFWLGIVQFLAVRKDALLEAPFTLSTALLHPDLVASGRATTIGEIGLEYLIQAAPFLRDAFFAVAGLIELLKLVNTVFGADVEDGAI